MGFGAGMELHEFELDGPFEIRPRKIEDDRGYFSETFRLNVFGEWVPGTRFVQDNQSLSVQPGTIRGIHFQSHPRRRESWSGASPAEFSTWPWTCVPILRPTGAGSR